MMSISIKANSVQLHHNNGLKNKNKIILITMTFMFPRATQAKPMCLSITSLWCLSPSKVLVYLWNSLTCLPFYLKLKILHTFMKCLGAVRISCFHSAITQNSSLKYGGSHAWEVCLDLFSIFVSITQTVVAGEERGVADLVGRPWTKLRRSFLGPARERESERLEKEQGN